MRNRSKEIKNKGFNMMQGRKDIDYREEMIGYQSGDPLNFAKIKVGAKTLDDAILDLGIYNKINSRLANKENVLRAINNYDLKTMREISDFFYKTSGIYNRILRYMAFMYCYDWYVTPYVNDENFNDTKVLEGFHQCLKLLDDFNVKKTFGEIALKVMRDGAYYGYKVWQGDQVVLQELPPNYCRSRLFKGQKPAVEFNMKFFDDYFKDAGQKMRVLKMFPAEFSKGYLLYKQQKLQPDFQGDSIGWYLLDPEMTVKFNANGEDYPAFISIVPLILDLNEAQELDRKKAMQRLLKIVIQKMPLDKNGELIFDVDEAQQLHNNAVQMLSKAIGVDVLTTFADVAVEDLNDTAANSTQNDDLKRVERQLFNESMVSQMLFNTEGNLALEKSILNDAATMYNLILQFESFLNDLISKYNKKPKKVEYRVQILKTTIYNYQELSKLYKEQTQLGYSKMLPQIALGQSQSSVLANAYFENDILDLVNIFIPPLMSSTMNADVLNRKQNIDGEEKKAGRKEKSDDQKSEKTIQNKESMS